MAASLLRLLEDPEVAKRNLRPFYRAVLRSTGCRWGDEVPTDPPKPLSRCSTPELGHVAMSRLLRGPLLLGVGWGPLRVLLRRVLAKYGVQGGGEVCVEREGQSVARPLHRCTGLEIGQLLLERLRSEAEGAMGQ